MTCNPRGFFGSKMTFYFLLFKMVNPFVLKKGPLTEAETVIFAFILITVKENTYIHCTGYEALLYRFWFTAVSKNTMLDSSVNLWFCV